MEIYFRMVSEFAVEIKKKEIVVKWYFLHFEIFVVKQHPVSLLNVYTMNFDNFL